MFLRDIFGHILCDKTLIMGPRRRSSRIDLTFTMRKYLPDESKRVVFHSPDVLAHAFDADYKFS